MTDALARRAPFADFARALGAPSILRQAITAATRRSETECVGTLIEAATAPETVRPVIAATATDLVRALRAKDNAAVSKVWSRNIRSPVRKASP
jgi:hypothetical protein